MTKRADGKYVATCGHAGCSMMLVGTREELLASGWLDCPRKGGKMAWLCPEHNPTRGKKPGPGLSTGAMVERKE